MSVTSDTPVVGVFLADPKFERLLNVGKEINGLLDRIRIANAYLAKEGGAQDFEEVEVARTQLSRELARDFAEARELLSSVDEVIGRLQEQERGLENLRKMSVGLARIEGLGGTQKQKRFTREAESTKARIVEIKDLIGALDALQKDLSSTRRGPHTCPRCSSANVSYSIAPSELGYTIYRCDACSNTWRITRFSLDAT